VSAQFENQLRWFSNWVAQHGAFMDVDVTYGSLTANYKVSMPHVDRVLQRF
jgi:hypothetical protein